MAHLGDEAIHLDHDHLGATSTAEAVHHHLNGLEKDTSREERRVGDHR
jgi:hypothetical protein